MKPLAILGILFALPLVGGCQGDDNKVTQRKVVAEQVGGFKPDLPSVPSIAKPNVPLTYQDGSYSVYGLRKSLKKLIEQEVTVTAIVANIYQKPVCPEGATCVTIMPHLFLADEAGETLAKRQLRLVGYASSFKDMEDEAEAAKTGKQRELPEGVELPPVVWDWQLGRKYKITGRFTRNSGAGFMETDGLIEYSSHQCLDCPPPEDTDSKK